MNILELAKRVGFQDADWNYNKGLEKALKQFADLVAQQEREACAALCFSIWNEWLDTPEEDRYKVLYDAEDCAEAIRARGTT